MSNSLRVKLSKLRYKGNITNDEYQELIKKLDGHDRQVKAEAIEEFGNWLFENGYDSSSHNIKAWITEYNLRDKVAEQLKEQK